MANSKLGLRSRLGLIRDFTEGIRGFGSNLLLDEYPNAAAAYSLRDLANASVGNAVVRVRRSSDNTEQDFTSTEITDGTLTTFTGANDGFVTTWYDQSGNSNDAAQSTANSQPLIVESGVVALDNAKPCIDWNQKNLILTDRITNVKSVFELANAEIATGGVSQQLLGDTNSYDYHAFDGFILDTQYSSEFVRNGNNYLDGNLTNFTTTKRPLQQTLYTMIHVSASGRVGQLMKDRPYIDRSWQGKMQEIIIYPSDQSANRTAIETNINTEYTIY